MTQNEKVKAAMSSMLKILEEGDLQTVARAVFRSELHRPSDTWSMMNRLIMFINGTSDARGYNQWQQIGRQVVKGSKAFYIMAPNTRKIKDEKTEDETIIVTGFRAIPVFAVEDTDGEPLPEDDFKLEIPARFDNIIDELNLDVAPVAFGGTRYGWYSPGIIRLATPEIKTFLHELCHAVDDKITGLKLGQHQDQEQVAEFGAAVIAQLLGYEIQLGNSKRYLESYGSLKDVAKFFNRIEQVVSFVIERTAEPPDFSDRSSTEAMA